MITPSEISPGGAKAIQKQVQMLQNIESPTKMYDILHLQLTFWCSPPSVKCDSVRSNKSTNAGPLSLPTTADEFSVEKSKTGMVDVVRKRQEWTVGGYVVLSETMSVPKTRAPLPNLLCAYGMYSGDALIHDVAKRIVVYPPRRARKEERKKGRKRRGAFSSATKFETRRVRPVPVGKGVCAVV